MKKSILFTIALAGFSLSFTSCKKIKEALNLEIGMNAGTIEFTLPEAPSGGNIGAEMASDMNIDSLLSANGTSSSKLQAARLDKIDLYLDNGDSLNNFEALAGIRVELATDTNPVFTEIAALEDNPLPMADPYHLQVPVKPGVDLKPYFSAHQFRYRISAGLRHGTTKELDCRAKCRYIVTVGG